MVVTIPSYFVPESATFVPSDDNPVDHTCAPRVH
jgi:hypothetical protein